MDMNVTELISNMGFPIFCCLMMFYQNSQMQKTLTDLSQTLTSMNERLSDIEQTIGKD